MGIDNSRKQYAAVPAGDVTIDRSGFITAVNLPISGQGQTDEQQDEIGLGLSVCSLKESLDAALIMLLEKALKGGVAIRLNLEAEACERIVTDRGMLQRVLLTLLANAVRFSPAGGTVEVSAVREADFIKITVADNGVGIRAKDMAYLFQPDTRQESAGHKGHEGSGIGLALTMRLVDLLGGRIRAVSEFGTGSRFSFTLPLRNCKGIT